MDLGDFRDSHLHRRSPQALGRSSGGRGNRIALVGSTQEVRRACGARTRVLDLPGRLVTPGFVDAHLHFINLGRTLQWVNLRNLNSLALCREEIRRKAAARPEGEWIVGRGWNHHQWAEKREPTRADLDDLCPDQPVMMIRACGHSVWVNSRALSLAGIDRETPDPPGGKIDRDPRTGAPTGLLREARGLIEKAIPAPTPADLQQSALAAQQEALRFGITGVHSCEALAQWDALAALEQQDRLKLRVHHLLPADDLPEADSRGIRSGYGSERLWFGKVKLFADGSLGSGTALLHAPYSDEPDQTGIAVLPLEVLTDKVRQAYRRGWDVAIHAIGDRAVSHALTAIAEGRRQHPGDRRDRIEHVQLFRPEDLALFREMRVVASVQPVFTSTDWQVAEKRWGADRCRYAYAWKSLLDAGIALQFGSDAPVEPINPVWGLQAAVSRQTPDGHPPGGWRPEEQISLEEAIRGFTALPAWTSRREADLGSIRPGKWADLTVFGQDLFALPVADWSGIGIEATVVDGRVAYAREGAMA